jgi:hypothetical protein
MARQKGPFGISLVERPQRPAKDAVLSAKDVSRKIQQILFNCHATDMTEDQKSAFLKEEPAMIGYLDQLVEEAAEAAAKAAGKAAKAAGKAAKTARKAATKATREEFLRCFAPMLLSKDNTFERIAKKANMSVSKVKKLFKE